MLQFASELLISGIGQFFVCKLLLLEHFCKWPPPRFQYFFRIYAKFEIFSLKFKALMNPVTLEDAIYKNAPAIEVYRQKIVQFLKQEVLKRATTFPYNLHGFIEQQPEVTATSYTCPLCNAEFKGE